MPNNMPALATYRNPSAPLTPIVPIAKRKYKATPQGKKDLKSATKLRPVILNHAPTKKKKTASILGISKVPPTSQIQPNTTNIYQRK
ncbi:hypothetical protein BACUNI_01853 [Bacteroides uniformis ATCC 8492]|uniref:Uncharacterized protein n=1 Tax=Bacteroides uniformis (strain ATCC 8492 / DSM 6597 / CCUG 4942 / CIP 103695 / JCM 5828 / KCTC 5204 / NCTC 13054 / VPI 0061) TaxID=411479 RepID=A0ABC9NCX4_BACUC|nr:hypothetical protein BACUNI_01853 [Bacteroides uniformis ATCC 8492]